MKLITPLAILALISGTHAFVIKRDHPVKGVITDILSRIDELDVAAKAFTSQIQPVVDRADNLIKSIGNGQRVADNAPRIKLGDAVAVFKPVKGLEDKAQGLFGTFQSRKEDVKKAKACRITREKLGVISGTSSKLMDTVLDKINGPVAKKMAKPYTDRIKQLLEHAQSLFSETSCIDG